MLNHKSPTGVAATGAFLLLTTSPYILADFFLTRSQNPFTLFQGQPLPLSATAPDADWVFDTSIDITNTLHAQSSTTGNLFVDFESYHLNSRLTKRLTERWLLTIDAPIIHRGGGLLDNAIDNWHRALGLPRNNRPNIANDQFRIDYTSNSTSLSITDETTGFGDISINAGYQLARSRYYDVMLWAGVELPTGDQHELTGNDHIDSQISVSAALHNSDMIMLNVHAGIVFPEGDILADNNTSDTVLFGYLSAGWNTTDWLELKIQFEAHQSYYQDASLDLLDHATVMVFGGEIKLNDCNKLDIGVSEDIDVGSSPDVSFLFNWHHRSAGC